MKRQIVLGIAAAAIVAGYANAETAPDDVKFVDGAVATSLSGKPGDPVEGEKIFTTKSMGNCIACHEVTALAKYPFPGDIGPSLDGVAGRWNEAELRGIVANAKMTYEGSVMPPFYKVSGFIRPGDHYTGKAAPADLKPILSAQQIEDVVAFLETLKEE